MFCYHPFQESAHTPMRFLAVIVSHVYATNKVFLLAGEQAQEWLVAIP